jgi:hypothetical protein
MRRGVSSHAAVSSTVTRELFKEELKERRTTRERTKTALILSLSRLYLSLYRFLEITEVNNYVL